MATYSSNTTIKIREAVAVNRTSNGTFFTVPANCYAEFQAAMSGGTVMSLTVGSVFVWTGSSGQFVQGVVAGPGQVVAATFTGTGYTGSVSGVIFENTP